MDSSKDTNEDLPTKLLVVKAFNPDTAILVENFQRLASEEIQNLLSTFGKLDVFDVVTEDDELTSIALAQYFTKTAATKAILALNSTKIRGFELNAQLMWNSTFYRMTNFSSCCSKEPFLKRRAMWIIITAANVTSGEICQMCLKFGKIEDIKFDDHDGLTLAGVIYESPISAALAAFCLNNGIKTVSGLMIGHRYDGDLNNTPDPLHKHELVEQNCAWKWKEKEEKPPENTPFQCENATMKDVIVQWPGNIRQYKKFFVPLSSTDVFCIQRRLQEYNRVVPIFTAEHSMIIPTMCYRPRPPDFCIDISELTEMKILMVLEVLLFDGNQALRIQDVSDYTYERCREAYLYRFDVEFSLYNPRIMSDDTESGSPRWGCLLMVDLLLTKPWDMAGQPEINVRFQEVNHLFDAVDPLILESMHTEFMFAKPVSHVLSCYTPQNLVTNMDAHKSRMSSIINNGVHHARMVGGVDNLNRYMMPLRITSKKSDMKKDEELKSTSEQAQDIKIKLEY